MFNSLGPRHFNSCKSAMDDYLGQEVTRQMLLRAKRDLVIKEIEELDRAIAEQKARRDETPNGSSEWGEAEAELKRLTGKQTESQEMLFQVAERLEQEEIDVEKLRKEWIRLYNSRESYAVSEKMPPLWFRLVIVSCWALAILILVGILPRG